MYRPRNNPTAQRGGVILLVVVTLLTLFAVVGLTFVLYAQSEATASRIYREAPEPGGELGDSIMSFALGELIYDVSDDSTGVYSAIRGHSLARHIYGWNDEMPSGNTAPFNGVGRLYAPSPIPGFDDFQLVNYTSFPTDMFLRDPERIGARKDLTVQRGPFTGGFNVPYTYPDLNNMFLAAVKGDGTVLTPSFHRHWLFNPGLQLNDQTNPNWTNAAGKYLLLRPRPADMGPGFPFPADAGGDVKNLVGVPGGNDSIWIDLGFPVKTLPDGRKYKPLFAFLVRDLDALVNLNVHGNIVGTEPNAAPAAPNGPTHRSNQGWGKTEVNVGKILPEIVAGTGTNEWVKLFAGNGIAPGRYGLDQKPGYFDPNPPAPGNSTQAPPFTPTPHLYMQLDYDGSDGLGGASKPPLLPGVPTNSPQNIFPFFPNGAAWDNGTGAVLVNHPFVFNYFNPGINGGGDSLFRVSELKKLLCPDPTGRLDLSGSLLANLCPQNFQTPASGLPEDAAKRRRLITPLSMDLDRPGVTPWVWDPASLTTGYQLTIPPSAATPYPTGAAIPFPALTLRSAGPPPANSDFNADWRAKDSTSLPPIYAALARVDLNRKLTDYPPPGVAGTIPVNDPTFATAQGERQALAKDIFDRLRAATGALDFTAAGAANTPPYEALRWLAQLAVNIVDYIDSDEYITPFYWNPTNPNEVVFGTEQPHVVLNEVYAQVDDDPTDPSLGGKKASRYNINVWAELYNPYNNDQAAYGNGDVKLQLMVGATPTPIYKITLYESPNNMRDPRNVDGTPNGGMQRSEVTDWGTTAITQNILANNNTFNGTVNTNQAGFYVIGPPQTNFNAPVDPGENPGFETATPYCTFLSPGMSYTYSPAAPPLPQPETVPAPTVLLRRLACPYLPPDANPTIAGASGPVPNPNYNPYVTVDYMEAVKLQDAAKYDGLGANAMFTLVANRFSVGRTQPYAAYKTLWKNQAPNPVPTAQPLHTFFRHNSVEPNNPVATTAGQTLQIPFDWLTHLDRQLISPMELLHVSGFKPHELTQQFMYDLNNDNTIQPNERFLHRAPWTDPNARIFRALEFLSTGERTAGGGTFGRIPGKININGIWDLETFQALCDAQTSNGFTDAQVQAIFATMIAARSPASAPGPMDHPFRGLATPYTTAPDTQYPNPPGIGINDTVLKPGLFDVPDPALPTLPHPYQKAELLTKIFNNITTRSNTFAVWCTVGYFQVTDDTVRPVKLGAEFGAAQGQNIRNRFFCIVDRTNLSLPGTLTTLTQPVAANTTATIQISTPLSGTVGPPTLTIPGVPWNIQPGTVLEIDAGQASDEIVLVTGVAQGPPATITAQFRLAHNLGATVTIVGLTGPPPIFLNATSAPYQDPGPPPTNWINVPALGGSYDGIGYLIQAGSTLVLDVGNNQETVSVLATGIDPVSMSPRFQVANFTKPHANGFVISNTAIGNPGPQPQFNYKDPRYAPVVRYFTILD